MFGNDNSTAGYIATNPFCTICGKPFMWVGDIPPGGYAQGCEPWCTCQDYPKPCPPYTITLSCTTDPIPEFINESGLEFKDISNAEYREYSCGLIIYRPLYLHVSASGGHRVFDAAGVSYYVQPKEGWWIKWKAKYGEPNFVK